MSISVSFKGIRQPKQGVKLATITTTLSENLKQIEYKWNTLAAAVAADERDGYML